MKTHSRRTRTWACQNRERVLHECVLDCREHLYIVLALLLLEKKKINKKIKKGIELTPSIAYEAATYGTLQDESLSRRKHLEQSRSFLRFLQRGYTRWV